MPHQYRKFLIKYKTTPFKINTIVSYIAIINNAVLVEDEKTKERHWVMIYDIYPFDNHDVYGWWEYNKYFQDKINKLIEFKENRS